MHVCLRISPVAEQVSVRAPIRALSQAFVVKELLLFGSATHPHQLHVQNSEFSFSIRPCSHQLISLSKEDVYHLLQHETAFFFVLN